MRLGSLHKLALVMGCGLLFALSASARPLSPSSGASCEPGIGQFLTADGRFDLEAARTAGYEGSLDLSGFVTQLDPNSGEPRFTREESTPSREEGDENWMGGFSLPGADGTVYAAGIYGANLVIGGSVGSVGPVICASIASWDGNVWSPLGSGTDGFVYALAVFNGQLVAAGTFLNAGGAPAARIARWNGTSWFPLGAGTDNDVAALVVYNAQLVAGGSFHTAGGVPANHIARWSGSWSPLGAGTGDNVSALAVYSGQLIAGDPFLRQGVFPRIVSRGGTARPGIPSEPA